MSGRLHEAPHLEVDLGSSCSHTQAESRCIYSTITFSKDEELILSEIWELGKETLQGFVIIFSYLREEYMKNCSCLWSFSLLCKIYYYSSNILVSPGHHQLHIYDHQSKNILPLQEILDRARWQFCSS